jgi:hypothetical protein
MKVVNYNFLNFFDKVRPTYTAELVFYGFVLFNINISKLGFIQ